MSRLRLVVTTVAIVLALAPVVGSAHAQSVQIKPGLNPNIAGTDRRPVPQVRISHCLIFSEPTRAKCLAAEMQQKPKPRSR